MNKWLEKYSNGDIVQQNYNDVSVSLPEGFVGMGYNTKGRNYSPAWGGQFEEGGFLPQAQKGKIVVTNLNDPRLKAYNDSLTVYNHSQDVLKRYGPEWTRKMMNEKEAIKLAEEHGQSIEDLYPNNKPLRYAYRKQGDTEYITGEHKKPVQPVVYQKPPKQAPTRQDSIVAYKKTLARLKNFGTGTPEENYKIILSDFNYYKNGQKEATESLKKDFPNFTKKNTVNGITPIYARGMVHVNDNDPSTFKNGIPIFAKPKEQEYPLVNKNIYKPKLKPGRITVPQMVTDEVDLPITQPRFPKGDYDYIFGPANSVIGRNYNGQFYSEDMPEQRGKVNQPDLDLLNNQEALKKYVQNKGLKFAMGGSLPGAVGFTYARTNDPAPSNGPYAKKTMPSAQDGWVTKAANAEFSCAANPRSNLRQSYSEYCNPKKGLDKDEYKALKNELSSSSMKDLLNLEEYYVLKNLADNQNRKMGREDNAYSKYFDQSTGLPIPNLTNELKEEGNLRATNRMYPGRKNLLVNDVYQGVLKDYNITTPQTPAQTKALLEKAYNIGYAIPKQQDGGFLPKPKPKPKTLRPIVINSKLNRAEKDSAILYNMGIAAQKQYKLNPNITTKQLSNIYDTPEANAAYVRLTKLNKKFPDQKQMGKPVPITDYNGMRNPVFIPFGYTKPVGTSKPKPEFSLKKKVTKAELLKSDRTAFNPQITQLQNQSINLPTIQNLPYRVEYYDGDINGMTHKNFIDEKAGSEFMKELQNRSYGIPYGVEAYYENTPKKEDGGWLNKYQDGGEEPLTKSSADWYKQWYEQRKTLPQFSRVAGERLNLLSTLPKVQLTPLEELQKFGAVGEYIKNRGNDASQDIISLADPATIPAFAKKIGKSIDVNVGTDPSVVGHEMSHWFDARAKQYMFKPRNSKSEPYETYPAINPSKFKKAGLDSKTYNWISGDDNPEFATGVKTELNSVLNELRQKEGFRGDQSTTPEQLQKIIDKYMNLSEDDLRKSSPKGNQNQRIRTLIKYMGEDAKKLSELNNRIVAIEKEDVPIAKHGGWLNKFDEGGEISPNCDPKYSYHPVLNPCGYKPKLTPGLLVNTTQQTTQPYNSSNFRQEPLANSNSYIQEQQQQKIDNTKRVEDNKLKNKILNQPQLRQARKLSEPEQRQEDERRYELNKQYAKQTGNKFNYKTGDVALKNDKTAKGGDWGNVQTPELIQSFAGLTPSGSEELGNIGANTFVNMNPITGPAASTGRLTQAVLGQNPYGFDNSGISWNNALAGLGVLGDATFAYAGLKPVKTFKPTSVSSSVDDVGKEFKINNENFYRSIDLDDATSSGVIRSKQSGEYAKSNTYFVEGKDFDKLSSTGSGASGGKPKYIFETPMVDETGTSLRANPTNATAEYSPYIANKSSIPISEGKIYKLNDKGEYELFNPTSSVENVGNDVMDFNKDFGVAPMEYFSEYDKGLVASKKFMDKSQDVFENLKSKHKEEFEKSYGTDYNEKDLLNYAKKKEQYFNPSETPLSSEKFSRLNNEFIEKFNPADIESINEKNALQAYTSGSYRGFNFRPNTDPNKTVLSLSGEHNPIFYKDEMSPSLQSAILKNKLNQDLALFRGIGDESVIQKVWRNNELLENIKFKDLIEGDEMLHEPFVSTSLFPNPHFGGFSSGTARIVAPKGQSYAFANKQGLSYTPSELELTLPQNLRFKITKKHSADKAFKLGYGVEQEIVNPYKEGGVIKDDMGYWNPENHGKVVEIDSPYITMEGVDQPLIGISDEGDQKYMLPGKNYKFKGKKVREYPVAKNGVRQEQKGLQNLDDLLNFTNYNKPQPGGWLNKYN